MGDWGFLNSFELVTRVKNSKKYNTTKTKQGSSDHWIICILDRINA